MNEKDFEGTVVLEKLAEIGRVDEFYEAIDSEDLQKAASLMRLAQVDRETIRLVLRKIADAEQA